MYPLIISSYTAVRRAGAFAFPYNDGLVVVAANLTYADFLKAKTNWDRAFHNRVGEVAPNITDMLEDGKQVDRMYAGCTRMFARKAYGPGWTLVGDAGMKKDPITAQSIAVAFEYAEKLADAIDDGFAGGGDLERALNAFERWRNERLMPYYDLTVQLALYRALQGNPIDIGQFFGCVTLAVSPDEFFAPDNIGRILRTAPP